VAGSEDEIPIEERWGLHNFATDAATLPPNRWCRPNTLRFISIEEGNLKLRLEEDLRTDEITISCTTRPSGCHRTLLICFRVSIWLSTRSATKGKKKHDRDAKEETTRVGLLESEHWGALLQKLAVLRQDPLLGKSCNGFIKWAPRVARYSFRSMRLLLPVLAFEAFAFSTQFNSLAKPSQSHYLLQTASRIPAHRSRTLRSILAAECTRISIYSLDAVCPPRTSLMRFWRFLQLPRHLDGNRVLSNL
jgi:hypothetical protein